MPIAMSDVDLKGKRVLIREDFNVPMKNGRITSDMRLRAALPTIKAALDGGAKVVMLMSHLGRPTSESYEEAFSLAPVAEALSKLLGMEIPLIPRWLEGMNLGDARVVLLENVRFHHGETDNNVEI